MAKRADVSVVVEPAQLDVVRNVAPHQVFADAIPGRPFGPQHAGMQSLDWRVADLVLGEFLFVEHHDVGIGIAHRLGVRAVVAGQRRGARCGDGCGGGEELAATERRGTNLG